MSTALAERPAVKKLLANARAAGARLKNAAAGSKETGIAAGIGFVSDYAVEIAEEHFPMLSDHYWATPAVMIVGGHLLRKKNNTAGLALAAVGGARLAAGMKAAHDAAPPPAQTTTQSQGANAGRIAVKRAFASSNAGRALPAPKSAAVRDAAARVAVRGR